jgi:hypothetical protein
MIDDMENNEYTINIMEDYMNKDEGLPVEIEEYISKTVNICKNLPQKYDNVEEKYLELCVEASNFLTAKFKNISNNDMYKFLSIYVTTFYNYMIKNNKKCNTHQGYLFQSAIRKYRDIIYCIENDDCECGLILFKTLYENILVIEFLAFHPECIELYAKFSIYTLINRLFNKEHNDDGQKINSLKKDIKKMKEQFGEKITKEYGWAESIIKKDKITSKDIFYSLFKKDIEIIDIMNEIVFDLISSNISELERFRLTGDNYYKLLLDKCMEVFGMQFLIKSFYDIFCDNNYFEANVFLKIIELSLLKWGYEFNIRK